MFCGPFEQYFFASSLFLLRHVFHFSRRRMRQAQVIFAELEKIRDSASVTFLCGDFNGSCSDACMRFLLESGFQSSFSAVHGREPGATHKNHLGDEVPVDFVLWRSHCPCGSQLTPMAASVEPQSLASEAWMPEFSLSDHRPLLAQFALQPCSCRESQ
eukprot:m.354211 g.354211  ORF g.354211 m.354211 type:complete len:158 (+) comp55933_c0_seq16:530-1003(+)